jgi:quinol monooxygenase YgiN
MPYLAAQIEGTSSCAKPAGRIEQHQRSKWTARHINTVLVEVYRSSTDPAEHKKTAHYQAWRDTVAEMMAEPRSSIKYNNVFPDDEGWG